MIRSARDLYPARGPRIIQGTRRTSDDGHERLPGEGKLVQRSFNNHYKNTHHQASIVFGGLFSTLEEERFSGDDSTYIANRRSGI